MNLVNFQLFTVDKNFERDRRVVRKQRFPVEVAGSRRRDNQYSVCEFYPD
jgi:hypothetical protein